MVSVAPQGTSAEISVTADAKVPRTQLEMSVVAAAGELAAELGILPWRRGEATWAAVTCMEAWLVWRGGMGAAEHTIGPDAVRDFIARFPRRFTEIDDPLVPPNHAGWIERARPDDGEPGPVVHWHIRPEVWNHGLFGDTISPRAVASAMLEAGMLKPSGEAHLAGKLPRAPASYPKRSPKDRPRVYSVIAAMLNRDDGE